MGLNITVMSYLGKLDFGIVADREQMPDLWSLIGWLRDALADRRRAGEPRRQRTRTGGGNGRRPTSKGTGRTATKAKPGGEQDG
jgi:WS/DGAT C-terminal domain